MKIDPKTPVTKLLWIDMEMSGLDPQKDRILEVAAIVTDLDFKQLASFESVINQPKELIDNMNQWCKTTHGGSGLIDKVGLAPSEGAVIKKMRRFIGDNFKNEPAVLAGNSIHQDRQFIRQWWPEVEELLHYRMLDVSSFKIIMQNKYSRIFTKKESHRALDDIQESIAELKYYLSFFKK